MEKTGLVLEGGGMRGLFTAGILDVWMENGILFNGLIGVSAGACFGCNYKSRQSGRTIRYNKKYANDPRYCSIRSLLTTGDLFNADFCYRELPEELDPFDKDAFACDPMEFHVCCTDVETGKAVYKKLDRVTPETYAWLRATASMPFVSRAVEIGGKLYLDGGLSDSIPLKYFESIGFTKNIVVTTRVQGYRKQPSKKIRLTRPLLRNYPAVYAALENRHVHYNETLDYIDRRVAAGAALLLAPSAPLEIDRTCHDPKRMQLIYDEGRLAAYRTLDAVRAFLG